MAAKPCAVQSCWGAQSCSCTSVPSPAWVSQCHVDGWCEPELDLLLAINLLPSSSHPASRTKSETGYRCFLLQFLPPLRYFCPSVMFAAICTLVCKQQCSSVVPCYTTSHPCTRAGSAASGPQHFHQAKSHCATPSSPNICDIHGCFLINNSLSHGSKKCFGHTDNITGEVWISNVFCCVSKVHTAGHGCFVKQFLPSR